MNKSGKVAEIKFQLLRFNGSQPVPSEPYDRTQSLPVGGRWVRKIGFRPVIEPLRGDGECALGKHSGYSKSRFLDLGGGRERTQIRHQRINYKD